MNQLVLVTQEWRLQGGHLKRVTLQIWCVVRLESPARWSIASSHVQAGTRDEIRAIKRKKEKKHGNEVSFLLDISPPWENTHCFLLLPILTSCRGQLWVMDLTAIDKKVKEQSRSVICLTTCICWNISLFFIFAISFVLLWHSAFVLFDTNAKNRSRVQSDVS